MPGTPATRTPGAVLGAAGAPSWAATVDPAKSSSGCEIGARVDASPATAGVAGVSRAPSRSAPRTQAAAGALDSLRWTDNFVSFAGGAECADTSEFLTI